MNTIPCKVCGNLTLPGHSEDLCDMCYEKQEAEDSNRAMWDKQIATDAASGKLEAARQRLMNEHKYQIRYQHRSWVWANSREDAIAAVKAEARQNRLYYADMPDGLYCYLDRAGKLSDDTGARAYAVICGPNQQGE